MNVADRRVGKVVLTTTGTLGDFLPLVAIALQLRALGLSPLLASMEEYRHAAEAEGLPFHAVRPGHREMEAAGLNESGIAKKVAGDLRAGFDLMLPYLDATLADLREVIADAELVITGTLAVVGRLVAEAAGVPVVTVILQPMGFLSIAEPPTMREIPFLPGLRKAFGPGVVRMLYAVGKAQQRSTMRPVVRLRRELGLPRAKDELSEGPLRSERIFAMYPPAFARLPSDAPAQAASAGFALYDGKQGPLAPELQAFLDAGPAPLVFTLGSFVTHAPGEFYAVSAEVARRLGRRAVLLVGQHAVARHASLASERIAVAGYASHARIFRQAAAVIQHGGMGTTAQALCAGVPQLVCPWFGDQFDNGARLKRLGVGEMVRLKRYTLERATAALEALFSKGAGERAKALAPAMAEEDGPAIVAAWVKERLG